VGEELGWRQEWQRGELILAYWRERRFDVAVRVEFVGINRGMPVYGCRSDLVGGLPRQDGCDLVNAALGGGRARREMARL
jgi:hypothetical protein